VTRDQIQSITLEILGSVAPDANLDNLEPVRSFRDQFEFDSVDYLNFVLSLEERLDVKIPQVEYPRLASLDGCVSYLVDKLAH